MERDLKKDKMFLKWNIERCRELYDTGILLDGNMDNLYTQSVFIEIMILLRHLVHVLYGGLSKDSVIVKVRDASAHPYCNRVIEGTSNVVDFCREPIGGKWDFDIFTRTFKPMEDACDMSYQYGDFKISAKQILKIIEGIEEKIQKYN